VFGRRRRKEEAEETAREAERRALFAELAKRPDSVCPFLGLADARAEYRPEPNGGHRCYAFGDPAPLSDDQQRHVCLERGYSNCPRYLRGVLVIPSEELEALRRPQAPAPPPPPRPAPASGGGRRGGLALVGVLLLLVAAVGVGGWYLLGNRANPIAGNPTASPTTTPTPVGSTTPAETPSATSVPTPSGSASLGPTPTPEPTPLANDRFDHYEVGVGPKRYTLFIIDPQQGITGSRGLTFGDFSRTPVVPLKTAGGLVYWQTSEGDLTGYAYVWGQSGDFQLREVFLTPQRERRVVVMTAAQATILPTATPAPR
jgi:hypothetical protein